MAHHTRRPQPNAAAFAAVWARVRAIEPLPLLPASTWPFSFSPAGNELDLTFDTPRPWAHVLANPNGFGTVVSNEGEIHSFNGNARQNALTAFRFESVPVSNPGQLVYVMDLESGLVDTPGFVPFRDADVEQSVHYALGSATFTKRRGDIELSLTVFVLTDGPADMRILTIRNRSDRDRKFRVVPYFDMALAESAEDSVGKLIAERDETTEALLFTNPTNDFRKGWAFVTTSLTAAVPETVRTRFFGGAGRDHTDPFMVDKGVPETSREDDGRRVAAFVGTIEVEAGGESDVVIVLGQTATRLEAVTMAAGLRDPATARSSLAATRAWWAERLNDVQVETSDPAFDRLVNHWLPYQVLASRLWGRNGPNQRGGAFGFRDQLQDVLPFIFFDPNLTRRQIVFHAGAQFPEGDVFKWWHVAPDGRNGLGQRTHASDPHPVASLRAHPLHRGHGRHVGAGRGGSLSRRAGGARGRRRPAHRTASVEGGRRRLRPRQAGDRLHAGTLRAARPAARRHGRLERRHRRGGRQGPRREPVALLLLPRHPAPLHPPRAGARGG